MRVLVVEDEKAVGEVFVTYLLELGHQPVLVGSAEAALDRLTTASPDAILLDVRLPGMSGFEFLQLPLVRAAGIPVVAVSGVATEHQARECLRLGAVDFIAKPVPLERLGEVLEVLEPYARERRPEPSGGRRERRSAPRAALATTVRVVEDDGTEWFGTSVTVSPFSVRIRPQAAVRPGRVVKLSFTPPDGGPALQALALLVREEPDVAIYFFADLNAPAVSRLSTLIARLQRA
ncbi:MAG: response regulator [candidate division NC10 bacterium]|nr:response regulator [candidate division NC10 bacterium]